MNQRPAGHGSTDHRLSAKPQDHRHATEDQANDHSGHNGPSLNAGQRRAEGHIDGFGEPLGRTFFSAKGLNRIEGIETFTGKAHRVGKSVLSRNRQNAHSAAIKEQGDQDHWDQEHDQAG